MLATSPEICAAVDLPSSRATGRSTGLAQSALCWSRRIVLGLVVLVGGLYTSLLGHRHLQGAPAFDDPAAYIDGTNCSVSPDGKTAYVFLQHTGRISYRDAIWAVDLESLERRLLPNAAAQIHPLWPHNPQCIASAPSYDGEHMLGAMQLGQNNYTFYATDLDEGTTRTIDNETFMADANASGWRFKRLPRLQARGGPRIQAFRAGASAVEPFVIDSSREPVVPVRHPNQFFYTDSKGAVHQYSSATGEDRVLDLENKAKRNLRVSPDARWLALDLGNSTAKIFEVDTGAERHFSHTIHSPLAGDFPVLHRESRAEDTWIQSGIKEERRFITKVHASDLRAFGKDRFLGVDAATEAAYVLDQEGQVLATLRAPAEKPVRR